MDSPLGFESDQRVAEGLVADPQQVAQRRAGHGHGGERRENAGVESIGWWGIDGIVDGANESEVEAGIVGELNDGGGRTGVAPVLSVELGSILASEQVQAAVRPGMQVARAAQGLPWLGGGGLADVVDQRDGHGVLTL